MNFTTSLPKKNPLVSYIVASAMRCLPRGEERKLPKHRVPDYRMHAVMLHRRPAGTPSSPAALKHQESFILCHLRKVVADDIQSARELPRRAPFDFKSNLPSKTPFQVS